MPKIISRSEALEKNLKYYYTGKPCIRNHLKKRHTNTGHCVDCMDMHRKTVLKKKREKNKGNLAKIIKKFENKRKYDLENWDQKRKKIRQEEQKNNKNLEIISYEEAIQKNLKYYFTGKPCRKGHIAQRIARDKDCLECLRARSKRYHKEGRYNEWIKNYRESDEYKKKRQITLKKYAQSEKGKLSNSIAAAKFRATEKYKKYRSKYEKDRRITDPIFKIKRNLRTIIYQYVKRTKGVKGERTIELTGCSLNELKNHLQKKFKDDMTWKNYGEWHIDHIKPASSFDLTKLEEQKKAFHYTNLQPLWAEENLKKSDKY